MNWSDEVVSDHITATIKYYKKMENKFFDKYGIIKHEKAKYPEYTNPKTRLKTFENWIYKMDKYDLANAGFFYLKHKDWCVCYACGNTVGNWEDEDIPFEEHRRSAPYCSFVLIMENAKFEEKEPYCTVCLEFQAQYAFLKCGHNNVVCSLCVLNVDRCPLCREKIVALLKTYN